MKDLVLPGQCIQRAGDSHKILCIATVIPGKTQEGADFSGGFRRWNLPDGWEEHRIRQEALLYDPVPQITDLLGGKSALFGAKFQFGVSQVSTARRLDEDGPGVPPMWRENTMMSSR